MGKPCQKWLEEGEKPKSSSVLRNKVFLTLFVIQVTCHTKYTILPAEFLGNKFRTKLKTFMRRKTTRDIKSRHNDCVISNSSGKKNRITEKKETKLSKSLVSRVIITNFHSIYFEGGKGRVYNSTRFCGWFYGWFQRKKAKSGWKLSKSDSFWNNLQANWTNCKKTMVCLI